MRSPFRYMLVFGLVAAAALPSAVGAAEGTPNLIVFVGERLSIEEFEPEVCDGCRAMDSAFRAKYRVLDVVFGALAESEITFVAYDHYGVPPFSQFRHSLLFISRAEDGSFYHQKYQFFPVYRTKAGKWAGCGPPYENEPPMHRHMEVQAHPVEYQEPVTFPLKGLSKEEISKRYPPDFYTYSQGMAYCLKGATIEGLFQVKRDGILKARGLFGE